MGALLMMLPDDGKMWLQPAGRNRLRGFMRVGAPLLAALAALALPNRGAEADEATPLAFPFRQTVDQLADTLHLRAKTGPVPDFVRKTRPDRAKLKFIPIGLPHPVRPLPIKTPDEVQALKDKLDAAAAAQQAPRAAPAAAQVAAPKHRGRKGPKPPAPDAAADQGAAGTAPATDPTN